MQITLELFQIFDLMAFTTAFILGLVFLFKSPKANIFLGLFLISLGIEVFQVFVTYTFNEDFFITLISFPTLVFLLFYVQKNILGYIPKNSWLVFVLGMLLSSFLPLLIDTEEFIIGQFLDYIFNLAIITYLFRLLTQHQKNVLNYYSEIEQKTLSWIKAILIIYYGFYALWIIEDIIGLFNQELPEIFAQISTIATCALVYWIGYKGLSQPEIFNQSLYKETIEEAEVQTETEKEIPIEQSIVNDKDIIDFNKVRDQISKQKLYTNSNLNLRILAIDLNLKEKELSRIINTQTNFYQLINSLRVEEFKKLLQSPKATQLSLLGLAQEAGFSSKSTFYAAFKKIEGITPKQYENSLK